MTWLIHADPERSRRAVKAAVAEARTKGTPFIDVIPRLARALQRVGLPWDEARAMAQILVHIAVSELPPR